MNWEVFTYGSGDKLRLVFNAVASIFGNGDYGQAMGVVALLGFIGYLTMSAFDQKGLNNFRWFIGMVFFYFAVLVPKVDVIVTDRIVPSNSAVVSNVPLGLAMSAGFFSKMGDWFARSGETVFSMPSQLNYTEHGLLFAHSMLESASKMRIHDGRTRQNLIEFIKSCVVIDGLGNRRFTVEDLERSPDLIDFFSNNVAEHAARFAYTHTSGTVSVERCRPGFTARLKPDIEALSDNSMMYAGTENFFVSKITGNASAAQAKMDSQIQNALNYLTGYGGNSDDVVNQFSMTNALADGWVALNKELDFDAGMQSLVLQKAERERESTFHATARMVDEALPMLKAIFEAFIYAIFPIIALLALISPAKASMGYIKALIWINLWAPIYVILHFFASYYDVSVMREIVGTHGGGFSAFANTALIEKMMTTKNTVAYLATSIPLIAWMLISQSGAMMSSFAGRVLGGYDQSASHAAGEAAGGRMQLAGHDIREVPGGSLMPNSPSGLETSHLSGSGQGITQHADGSSTVSNPMSKTELDSSLVNDYAQTKQSNYETAQSRTEGLKAAQTESAAAGFSALDSFIEKGQHAEAHNQNFSHGDKNTMSYAATQRDNLVEQVSEKTGVGADRAQQIMAGLSAGGTGYTGTGKEFTKEEWDKVANYMESEEFAKSTQYAMEASLNHSAQFGGSWAQEGSETLQAAYTTAEQASKEYSLSLQETETARQQMTEAEKLSERVALNQDDKVLEDIASGLGVDKSVAANMIHEAARAGDYGQIDQLLEMSSPAISRDMELPGVDVAGTKSDINDEYEQGRAGVAGAGAGNAARVESKNTDAGVTRETQESIVDHRLASVETSRQSGVGNAGSVQDNADRDRILNSQREVTDGGEEAKERVDSEIETRDTVSSPASRWLDDNVADLGTVGDLVDKVKGWVK